MIEIEISRVIIEQYSRRLSEHLENDVVIVVRALQVWQPAITCLRQESKLP